MPRSTKYLKHKKAMKRALAGIDIGDNPYSTTQEAVDHWFGIFNKGMFKGRIPTPKVRIVRGLRKRSDNSWGEAECWSDNNRMIFVLRLNHQYPNEKFFCETVAHEMVHFWQFMQDTAMNHGRSFKRWSNIFKKTGLRL
jgi:hypothetical protein